ncbi:adenine deaminase [Propionigenium maris DSM 9537]|uniref:Adenine deaminase n=1 Tax=Propionigenium maris DSM 9537 TaxID=1123000 RepID=A0A9W6GKU0_9FUSO|nr:adenine deaminase [Propionigenium maris]GLI55646.1 adenine deaminase [Propionigenium maris DSM 9537]
MNNKIKHLIDVAAKRKKAELLLKNCRIVDVFSGEIAEGNLAIDSGKIVGIGDYQGLKEIDLNGKFLAPGLIDSHVHMESSMISPGQFARAVVPRGTTGVVTDPHEIANVCGLEGIKFMMESSRDLPLNVYFMLPSCVPATPFENSGAVLEAEELAKLIDNPAVLGLGEMMNYPGVIEGNDKIVDKLKLAQDNNRIVDGHSPDIVAEELNAYVIGGVKTDHECSTVEEMKERLRRGMYISIREGSAARNLEALIEGITPENERRCLFCTDDRHPEDIIEKGHIDNNVRTAIKKGIDPISAIRMATINVCECYGIKNLGAIAPGYDADLIVVDSLEDFNVVEVIKDGRFVAREGKPLFELEKEDTSKVTDTINFKEIVEDDLKVKLTSNRANVMRLLSHSLLTEKVVREVERDTKGYFKFNKDKDLLKLAVIERHNATGNIGFSLVENFNLKGGAIASTVSNDSHNILVIGDNDRDMYLAVEEIKKMQGGVIITSGGEVLKKLELPIAGLMSDKPIEVVKDTLEEMHRIAYDRLGVNRDLDPFMTLAFLALPVIPDIKVTDKGLFDVVNFKFIDISVED